MIKVTCGWVGPDEQAGAVCHFFTTDGMDMLFMKKDSVYGRERSKGARLTAPDTYVMYG